MQKIIEHRGCQCEDRPCCGCDNGTFEIEQEKFEYPGDSMIDMEMEEEYYDDEDESNEVDSREYDGQPDEVQEWESFDPDC